MNGGCYLVEFLKGATDSQCPYMQPRPLPQCILGIAQCLEYITKFQTALAGHYVSRDFMVLVTVWTLTFPGGAGFNFSFFLSL